MIFNMHCFFFSSGLGSHYWRIL